MNVPQESRVSYGITATTSNPAVVKVMFSSASDQMGHPQAFYDETDPAPDAQR